MLPALFLLPAVAAMPAQLPLGAVASAPRPATVTASADLAAAPRPLVLWHGLGDTSHSEGMDGFADFVRKEYPGIFVHSVTVPPGGSEGDERNAGFWGVGEEQAQAGCDQIAEIPELANGFDAIGFSQGGLFLRWYAQFCDGPKVYNLITFGSPHYGIAALIPCPDPPTLSCRLAARAAKAGIYTLWAQSHLVQAQYYRDPERLGEFLFANTFIRDLNAEGVLDGGDPDGGDEDDRTAGGKGLGHLDNLVAYAFTEDTTLFPALSAHWATPVEGSSNSSAVVELRDQLLYKDDWIGLKALDKKDRLHLGFCEGQHMDLGGEGGCGHKAVQKWLGWKGEGKENAHE